MCRGRAIIYASEDISGRHKYFSPLFAESALVLGFFAVNVNGADGR